MCELFKVFRDLTTLKVMCWEFDMSDSNINVTNRYKMEW